MDEFWVEQTHKLWEMRDYDGVPPLPQEIMHYPEGYIDMHYEWYRGIKYYRDSGKREAGAWL